MSLAGAGRSPQKTPPIKANRRFAHLPRKRSDGDSRKTIPQSAFGRQGRKSSKSNGIMEEKFSGSKPIERFARAVIDQSDNFINVLLHYLSEIKALLKEKT